MINDFKRVYIFGVPVDIVHMNSVLEWARQVLEGNEKGKTIFSVNPEKVMLIRKNRHLLQIFNNSNLLIPDGTGIVWAVRRMYGLLVPKVTGIDLMENIYSLAEKVGCRIFILGSHEETNRKAAETLKQKHPSIQITGRHHGYFAQEDNSKVITMINNSGAEVLFVGLGSPAQEQWVSDNSSNLNVKLCMGVGGALDVLSGKVPRAPEIIRRIGLEWLFRLIRQPRRIRRQMALIYFVLLVFRHNISCKYLI